LSPDFEAAGRDANLIVTTIAEKRRVRVAPEAQALFCRRRASMQKAPSRITGPFGRSSIGGECSLTPPFSQFVTLATRIGFARRSASTITPNRSATYLNGYLILFRCRTYHANSHEAGAFETVRALAARLRRRGDEFHISEVVQLRAAVPPCGFALPQHLNLMSSDANYRAGSARLTIVPAHPNDAVA
jgi:hypothetical protein